MAIEINCPECANYFKSELSGEGQTCYCKECGRTYEIELIEIWKGDKRNKFPVKDKMYWINFLTALKNGKICDVVKGLDRQINELNAELSL